MLSAEDNGLLTRTGAGTPMGDFFRRFWLPVLLSQELPAPDGPPVRPHRGANLFFGRNGECGLRCAYHGWKFDADGRCVDMTFTGVEGVSE